MPNRICAGRAPIPGGFASIAYGIACLLLVAVRASAQEAPPSCTDTSRQCLISIATAYLEAVVHHDASKVPFAPDVKRVEQGIYVVKGEQALRKSVGELPAMLGSRDTRFYVDEQQQQVMYFTLLGMAATQNPGQRPSGEPTTVHLAERFRIERGMIKEIEAMFYLEIGTSAGTSGFEAEAVAGH
jgi:hypothetical protein